MAFNTMVEHDVRDFTFYLLQYEDL
ncbi:uncharacterized protein METZ01_LOCUS275154 [marine metagenome]|uniref:Uncharacterized protein n=1 Tax=marine metagenome TaxID=408172 RepID=A0A382KCV0_9ZZZZ